MLEYNLREMKETDYEEVYALWSTISGLGLRSIEVDPVLRSEPRLVLSRLAESRKGGCG